MSNTIPPFSASGLPESVANPASAETSKPASSSPAASGAQSESVTLSAAAQASTQLLTSARQASGVDQTQVAAIRAQIANGSYNVAPEDLAQAIATVLKETNP